MQFRPHNYQSYCIQRIINDSAVGLFLDMGLGKTVITLTAVNDLKYNRFQIQRCLVIAPKKVAEATWGKEAEKWDHLKHLRISKILGTESKRVRAVNTPADVYVINRENVPWLVDHYRNDWKFDMVVVDELSSFKSHKAKRFKCLSWVRPHIKKFVGLTGTPAPNGIMDLWAQVYLLDGGKRLGKTISAYRQAYFVQNTHGGNFSTFEERKEASEEIKQRLSDICISMKAEDYIQLPERTDVVVPVQLDSKARKAYDTFEREMFLQIDEESLDAGTAAVLSGKLLQMCNGAVYGENGVVNIHNCKLEAFMELVEAAQGQPMLVLYNFKHDLDRIKSALAKTKLAVGELKTESDIDKWNAGKLNILLAHPASAAYGLNLQAGGSHIVWFGLNWSLELYQQANARLYRQGQQEKVIIHHLVVEDSTDELVMSALSEKEGTQNLLLEALKAKIKEVKNN
ncbi:MAG: SNF2-related protein [Lachnospiraceae bacterium]|nr:DEAD/DEAH box helicase [Acutalibacteraceae bacterium]DAY29221.1 MAG TPA: Chromatin remodeling complex ATPase [Caudoviricetes sp.]